MGITPSRSARGGAVALAIGLALSVGGCGVSRTVLLHEIDLVGPVPASAVCGARAEARALGWPLRVRAVGSGSAGERIVAVDAAIDAKPSGVLVATGDQAALAAPLQSARSTGIVVTRLPRSASAGDAAAAVRLTVARALHRSLVILGAPDDC